MKLSFVFTDLKESEDFIQEISKMYFKKDGVSYFNAKSKTHVRCEYIASCECKDEKSEEIQQIAARFNGKELPEELREARCDLYMGITDVNVTSLKYSLASIGYYEANLIFADNYFDESLEKGLEAFQQDHELPPTGVANWETQQKIEEAIEEALEKKCL
jgi:peptidoglycan hydrolase-like protein with peptidoglycan-binding domain